MYNSKSIALDQLLTYSEIYSLGITQADVTHLEAINNGYGGNNLMYIYKPTSKNYDIALNFYTWGGSKPSIAIIKKSFDIKKVGYPCFKAHQKYLSLS